MYHIINSIFLGHRGGIPLHVVQFGADNALIVSC
jgi:hypothetical protein